MKWLSYEGPIFTTVGRIVDFLCLNLLTVLLSIPIFTYGAAQTAKYYVTMKIVRKEEPTVLKPFFRSFKENFKTSTKVSLILLPVFAFVAFDWYWIFANGVENIHIVYRVAVFLLTLLLVLVNLTVFPLLARYDMKPIQAIKQAILFSYMNIFWLILVIIAMFVVVVIAFYNIKILPFVIIFGHALITYLLSLIFANSFHKVEMKMHPEMANEPEDPDANFVPLNFEEIDRAMAEKIEAAEADAEEEGGADGDADAEADAETEVTAETETETTADSDEQN